MLTLSALTIKMQVNIYLSDGWSWLHQVSLHNILLMINYSLMMLLSLLHQMTPVQEVEQGRPMVTLNMPPSLLGKWVTAHNFSDLITAGI